MTALNKSPVVSSLNKPPVVSPPSIANHLVTADELAPALGLTVADLKRRAASMHRRLHFPQRLPGADWRWSRRAVEAWIAGRGGLGAFEPHGGPPRDGPTITLPDLVAEQHDLLSERYGGRS